MDLDRLRHELVCYGLGRGETVEDAEDAAQEALLAYIDRDRPVPGNPLPWLKTVTRRRLVDAHRARLPVMEFLPGSVLPPFGPLPTLLPADGLLPINRRGVSRCARRQYSHNALPTFPCPICGTPTTARKRARGEGRRATCGAPKCVAQYRERRRKEQT